LIYSRIWLILFSNALTMNYCDQFLESVRLRTKSVWFVNKSLRQVLWIESTDYSQIGLIQFSNSLTPLSTTFTRSLSQNQSDREQILQTGFVNQIKIHCKDRLKRTICLQIRLIWFLSSLNLQWVTVIIESVSSRTKQARFVNESFWSVLWIKSTDYSQIGLIQFSNSLTPLSTTFTRSLSQNQSDSRTNPSDWFCESNQNSL